MKLIPQLPPAFFEEQDTWGSGDFRGIDQNGVAQIGIRRGAPPSRFTVNHEAGHALVAQLGPQIMDTYWQVRGLPGTRQEWPKDTGNIPWLIPEEMFADDLGALVEPDDYEAYAQRATGVPYNRSVMDALYRGLR